MGYEVNQYYYMHAETWSFSFTLMDLSVDSKKYNVVIRMHFREMAWS